MKKKVISLLAVLALCLAFAVPAFAADTQYKVGDYVSYSGHTDFGYYYTYTVKDVNYKCFSVVSADGQRYMHPLKKACMSISKAPLQIRTSHSVVRYNRLPVTVRRSSTLTGSALSPGCSVFSAL